MDKYKKISGFNWLYIAWSYLFSTLLICDEILEPKHEKNTFEEDELNEQIKSILKEKTSKYYAYHKNFLVAPLIYQIRHAIEIFIKMLRKFMNKELKKGHDVKNLFEILRKEINEKRIQNCLEKAEKNHPEDSNIKIAIEGCAKIIKSITTLEDLVIKYSNYNFLKDKINGNFTLEDEKNDAFRYPENSLQLCLDYSMVCESFKESDFEEIRKDIEKLMQLIPDFGFVISIYGQYSEEYSS